MCLNLILLWVGIESHQRPICIYPTVGLDCTNPTMTRLLQLHAQGTFWVAYGGWIITKDEGGNKGLGGAWKLSKSVQCCSCLKIKLDFLKKSWWCLELARMSAFFSLNNLFHPT